MTPTMIHRLFSQEESDSCILQRYRNTSEEEPNVVVRVGSQDFIVCLMPLLKESLYFLRLVNSMFSLGTVPRSNSYHPKKETIVVPDNIPCSPDIFKIVINFCYQRMEENEISTTNVVMLIVASDLLEMASLKSRAVKFLDETVLTTWRGCLAVLSTFESENLTSPDEDSNPESEVPKSVASLSKSIFKKLFEKVLKTTLDNLGSFDSEGSSRSFHFTRVLQVVELLPFDIAELVCPTILVQRVGLFYITKDGTRLSLCHYAADPSASIYNVIYYGGRDGSIAEMMDHVRSSLPDGPKRSLLFMYVARFITGQYYSQSVSIETLFVCLDFLCSLVIEATKLLTTFRYGLHFKGLRSEMPYLHECVGSFFPYGSSDSEDILTNLSGQHTIQSLVYKFDFYTLLYIVEAAKIFAGKLVVRGAKVLDACLLAHLKDDSFTIDQVLEIFQQFPNYERQSHVEIYRVLEDYIQREDLSADDLHEISNVFDYDKLPDEIVELLLVEFGHHSKVARLRERVDKIQEARKTEETKCRKEVVRLRTELREKDSVLQAIGSGKEQVECQLVRLHSEVTEHKRRVEIQLSEMKLKLNASFEEKAHVECNLHEKSLELQTLGEDKRQLEFRLQNKLSEMKSELRATGELKTKVEKELETVRAGKRLVERELEQVTENLEREKEKTACAICFVKPRDCVSLPCGHFHYCSECLRLHYQSDNKCPTCRDLTTSLAKCIM